jgi:hypothetical protein
MASELGTSNGAGFGGAYSGYPATGVGTYATVSNGSGAAASPDENGWGERYDDYLFIGFVVLFFIVLIIPILIDTFLQEQYAAAVFTGFASTCTGFTWGLPWYV